MEIRLGDTVILSETTVNTPFKCDCKGTINTKPLNSNDPQSSEMQKGVQPNTLTISFLIPFGQGDVIEEIENLRQENEPVDISSDEYFDGEIKLRKVRSVQITSFTTLLTASSNDMATSCTLVLLQKNSPDELAKQNSEENLSLTPSDPASGFTISETIAYHSAKQKETKGLFLGDSVA
ncbi:hypothetical protein KAR91_58655 [Candidatus Pacearchaeota archaeon]|nr:hypothetical protein [Candidatus Pacearchaeota archaeon]